MQAVRDSVEKHAQRKGYTTGTVNDKNQLLEIDKLLGIGQQHAIGEIVYKAAEFLKTPRAVLLEKIAGWCWVVWRQMDNEDKPAGCV